MIELILSTLNNIIAQILNAVISFWGSSMKLSMSTLIGQDDPAHGLPFLATGYSIFQAMALAFTILIAAVSIYSIFLSAGQAKTSPVRVLVMTGAAIGMIYFGNRIAMLLVDFAKNPYEQFWSAPLSGTGINVDVTHITIDVAALFIGGSAGGAVALTGLAKTAAMFILTVAIVVALFKLYVELFERYLMVGVTVYAFAPLAYATIASDQTIHIFKRWLSMFIGQLILMSMSVWSLKLILSGFAGMSDLFQCFLVLACCHVAQRLDTYLAQLGLNVVTTGGNLMDEAIGAGVAIAGFAKGVSKAWTGGKGNNSKAILGENYGREGNWGGVRGAFSQFSRARKEGASFQDAVKAGANGFTTNASMRAQQIKEGERVAAQNARNAQSAARNRSQNYTAARDGDAMFTKDFTQMANAAHRSPAQFAKENLRNEGSGRFSATSGYTAGLDETAKRAGLSFATPNGANPRNDTGSIKTPMASVVGPDASVKDFMAKNYNVGGTPSARNVDRGMQMVYRDASDAVLETAKNSTPRMAADILAHPGYDLAGNDAVGSELMNKAFGPAIGAEGKFSNVTAFTEGGDNGARHIYAVHTDADGLERGYEVLDEVGYYNKDISVQNEMREIHTEDGTRFFVHEVPAEDVREVSKETIERLDSQEPTAKIQSPPDGSEYVGGDFDDDNTTNNYGFSGSDNSGWQSHESTQETGRDSIAGETEKEKRERKKKRDWDPER